MKKNALQDPVSVYGLIKQLRQDLVLGRAVLVFRPAMSKEELAKVDNGTEIPGYYTFQGVDGVDWKPLLDELGISSTLPATLKVGSWLNTAIKFFGQDERGDAHSELADWSNGIPTAIGAANGDTVLAKRIEIMSSDAKSEAQKVFTKVETLLVATETRYRPVSNALSIEGSDMVSMLADVELDDAFLRVGIVAETYLRILDGDNPREIVKGLQSHSSAVVRQLFSDTIESLVVVRDLARREPGEKWMERIKFAASGGRAARHSYLTL